MYDGARCVMIYDGPKEALFEEAICVLTGQDGPQTDCHAARRAI